MAGAHAGNVRARCVCDAVGRYGAGVTDGVLALLLSGPAGLHRDWSRDSVLGVAEGAIQTDGYGLKCKHATEDRSLEQERVDTQPLLLLICRG